MIAESKSSLNGIIRKLTSTLTNLRTSHPMRQPNDLDYGSLVSLCSSSRSDAIRTMSDLSTRLSNASRSSVAGQAASSHAHHSRKRHHRRNFSSSSREEIGDSGHMSRRHSSASRQFRKTRVSRLTMSTDSTKLGEVRRRESTKPVKPAYPRRLQTPYRQGMKTRDKKGKSKRLWEIF